MKKTKTVYEEAELCVTYFAMQDVIATSSPYDGEGDTGDWTPERN